MGDAFRFSVLKLFTLGGHSIRNRQSSLAMPNGGSHSYRDLVADAGPAHSSDSEETYVNKHRHLVLVKWVVARWRLMMRRRLSLCSRGSEGLRECPGTSAWRLHPARRTVLRWRPLV